MTISTWAHSAWFHAALILLTGAASAGIAAVIDFLRAGTVPINAYAVFGAFVSAALGYLAVQLRDKLEAKGPPVPIQPQLPVRAAPPTSPPA